MLQDSAGPDGSQTRSNMLGGRLSRPVAALAKQTAHAMTAVTASTRAPALAPRLRSRVRPHATRFTCAELFACRRSVRPRGYPPSTPCTPPLQGGGAQGRSSCV